MEVMEVQRREKVDLRRDIAFLIKQAEPRGDHLQINQERVAKLSCAIGEKLGFDLDTLRGLRMAAMLHDIGMVTIPVEMLDKPHKLSDVEFDHLRKHPQTGFEMLKHVEFPWPIADIILQHHEHFDGTGYPFGLTDTEICDEAKIIAVADSVEAITAIRPYRPAAPLSEALFEIESKSGRLYDPDVVEALLRLVSNGKLYLKGCSWE